MSYVIAEPCVSTCDQACVRACPVDAIHGPPEVAGSESLPVEARARKVRGLQLYIDPEGCICCAACEGECPVGAIFDEDDVPPAYRASIAENAAFFPP